MEAQDQATLSHHAFINGVRGAKRISSSPLSPWPLQPSTPLWAAGMCPKAAVQVSSLARLLLSF